MCKISTSRNDPNQRGQSHKQFEGSRKIIELSWIKDKGTNTSDIDIMKIVDKILMGIKTIKINELNIVLIIHVIISYLYLKTRYASILMYSGSYINE